MAIDGRDLAKKTQDQDAYQSPAVRVFAHAIVWIPLLIVLWIAYESGVWIGGVGGGIVSVLSTVATVGVIWAWNRLRRKRR